jgi:hypothetical protein
MSELQHKILPDEITPNAHRAIASSERNFMSPQTGRQNQPQSNAG